MKILNTRIRLVDWIPPILVPPLMKIKARYNISLTDKGDSPIVPFVSPTLGSYSQFNEDLIIDLLFELKRKRFYDKGWSGINIEPGKESFEKLCLSRPRDVNLNIGVGVARGTSTFYHIVENSQLSSFDKKLATVTAEKLDMTMEETQIEVWRLVDIFEQYIEDKYVDFMSVDAEGLDLEVLQSNDWGRFRPAIVMVEIDKLYQDIIGYMKHRNYALIWNNEHNGIFVDEFTSDNHLKSIVCNG